MTIARIAGTESAVLREIDAGLAKSCKLQQSTRELALVFSKYGFLDLIFLAPAHLLKQDDHARSSTLRELRFIGPRGSANDGDQACLQTLMEGIDEGKCWLRLFLFGEPAMDTIKRVFEQYRTHPRPNSQPQRVDSTMFQMERALSKLADCVDGRFPLTFTIQDACLSNSDAIWLATHGYL